MSTREKIVRHLASAEGFTPGSRIVDALASYFEANGYDPEEFCCQQVGPWTGTPLFYMYDLLSQLARNRTEVAGGEPDS